jgi:tyrosine-protein phosphatase YwqE
VPRKPRKNGAFCGVSDVIDLHCHLLPEVDDGAQNLSVSLTMARAAVAQGVTCDEYKLRGLAAYGNASCRSEVEKLLSLADVAGRKKIALIL